MEWESTVGWSECRVLGGVGVECLVEWVWSVGWSGRSTVGWSECRVLGGVSVE